MNTEERQLTELLQRMTPEPPRGVTVEDVAIRLANQATGHGKAGGSGRRDSGRRAFGLGGWRPWTPVVAAGAVVGIAAASAGIAVALSSSQHQVPRPSAGRSSVATTPSVSNTQATSSPTTTPASWPATHLAGAPWGAELIDREAITENTLAFGGSSLYALGTGGIIRMDAATGDVLSEHPFGGVNQAPVVAGGAVWAVSSYSGGSAVLQSYDPKTLAPGPAVTVPAAGSLAFDPAGILAAGPNGDLYLAAGTKVAVVNPASRQVIKTISVSGGPVSSLAVAPDGSALYVGSGAFQLGVYNPATGAQVGSSSLNIGGAGGNLVASAGGVWGTLGTNMSQTVWFAPKGNLSRFIKVNVGAGAGEASAPTAAQGVIWLGGRQSLACLDPVTGKSIASAAVPADSKGIPDVYSSVVGSGGSLYGYYEDHGTNTVGMVRFTPPAACSAAQGGATGS